ncbi:type I restriction enzyme S subunit [Flavobacterium sp. 28A]|uniref:restriction endonuclease subunit S n=1 Tax=Flavobacterium sp. 28A TaxID=2735895 RepID=UPI00156F2017|nr:restriction endonuclease subunit S [Flavobacterium sp. 28A]NRT16018.1 type I restriction enzyme S subunit [Flavobacterium sp. 28A]
MGSNYKRLGDYIQEVNIRNKALIEAPLMGVSIKKVLMPSIANIIGTDMSTYKLIQKNQFAYGPVTSRNGDKISIALLEEHDHAMVSQAYTVFEVIDNNELHPEYLMMWFRRPEFDRYARYMSHGSAREIFSWTEMCDTLLPIPSPEKQLEIVKEYNTIQNRIQLNNQLITKLEETAQAIYKQWFVDFEFPDENNKPYKSNGGEMVFCEELDKEIPVGWEMKPFTSVVKLSGGGTPSTEEIEYWNGSIPFYTPGDLVQNYFTIYTSKHITALGLQKCSSKLYQRNTTFVTARGATVGGVSLAGEPMAMNQTCYAIISNDSCSFFAHQLTLQTIQKLKKEATGATFEALVTKDFDGFLVLQPDNFSMITFEKIITNLYQSMLIKSKLNQKLEELKFLLLARMTKV